MEASYDIAEVDVEELLTLRDAALSPGHPNRPVLWPYDHALGAVHFGMYSGAELVACVSAFPDPRNGSNPNSSYRFHSMGVLPQRQGTGLGTIILVDLVTRLRAKGATLMWATARSSALGFYERLGLTVSDDFEVVAETGFEVRVVELDSNGMDRLLSKG